MRFSNVFTYDTATFVTMSHILYSGVHIDVDLQWDRGSNIEAVFDTLTGVLFFQEWIDGANIWNKSPDLHLGKV
jgi:hypothetical protein